MTMGDASEKTDLQQAGMLVHTDFPELLQAVGLLDQARRHSSLQPEAQEQAMSSDYKTFHLPSSGFAWERFRKCFSPESSHAAVEQGLVIKAVFFDMDSTVVEQECIVEMARACRRAEPVARITEQAMAGDLNFAESLSMRLQQLKGFTKSDLESVMASLRFSRGVKDLCAYLKSKAIPMYLVSGGFLEFARPISERLAMTGVKAHRLAWSHNLRLTGEIEGELVDGEAKKAFVLETCKELSISPTEVAFIGDGANDLAAMQVSGLALGFAPKPVLYPYLSGCSGVGDHIFFQGLL